MKLTPSQIKILKRLMIKSARKGNLANSGMVLENGRTIATAESLVVSQSDATAHSERMLVQKVGHLKGSNWTPGLTMVSVVEPCIMCLSACSQAGYKEICFMIPGNKYVKKIPWTTDATKIKKGEVAKKLSSPVKYTHLNKYEKEFSEVFEAEMGKLMNINLHE